MRWAFSYWSQNSGSTINGLPKCSASVVGVVAAVGDHQVDLRDHLGLRQHLRADHVVRQRDLDRPAVPC